MTAPDLIYYVAQSLDGYITGRNENMDWLNSFGETGEDYGYTAFYDSVDSLMMGGNTYRFVQRFGKWPYPGKPCWVISRTCSEKMDPSIELSSLSPDEILNQLANLGYKRTWLVGGASLAKSFLERGLISEFIITIIPVMLGGGLPLLADVSQRKDLILKEKKTYDSGVIQLTYFPENQ